VVEVAVETGTDPDLEVEIGTGLGPGLKDEEDLQVIDLNPEGGIEMEEGTGTEETRATINIYNCIE